MPDQQLTVYRSMASVSGDECTSSPVSLLQPAGSNYEWNQQESCSHQHWKAAFRGVGFARRSPRKSARGSPSRHLLPAMFLVVNTDHLIQQQPHHRRAPYASLLSIHRIAIALSRATLAPAGSPGEIVPIPNPQSPIPDPQSPSPIPIPIPNPQSPIIEVVIMCSHDLLDNNNLPIIYHY